MKILITGVGGPTPRSFAHALKCFSSKYRDVSLIATDSNPLAIGLYQPHLFEKSFVIPRADAHHYWHVMEEIIQANDISLAVILPEFEILHWSKRAQTHPLPCKVFLPDLKLNELLMSKSAMTEVLKDLNLVPESIAFSRNETDLQPVFQQLGSNFWVRSSSGTSGLGSLQVDSLQSLQNWIQINPGVSHFLASKYLPGRNLACKLLYWKGKLLRSACGERVNYIMSKVAPSGITGNTSFGRLLNAPHLVDLSVKAMDRLFEYTQAPRHGFFTVDFKEDEMGNPFITEINVRHVAFTQCFAAAGANFAEDTIRLLADDADFSFEYKMYEFEPGKIFLRDVDERPIIMKEEALLK